MTDFDKSAVKKLRDDLQAVLDNANVKGLTLQLGNATFSPTEVTFKLSVKADGHEDRVVEQTVKMFGFERSVSLDGNTKLVGYRPKARTRPFIIEQNGKQYVTNEKGAYSYFGGTRFSYLTQTAPPIN